MLAASLANKSLKLLYFLALSGFYFQVSHGMLNNLMSSMERYAYQGIFFSFNGSNPALANSFQYSMQVNSTEMGVVGSHCESNSISFSCSCLGGTVQ